MQTPSLQVPEMKVWWSGTQRTVLPFDMLDCSQGKNFSLWKDAQIIFFTQVVSGKRETAWVGGFFFFYNMKRRPSISIAETTEGWISNISAMPNGLSNKLCYDPLCRQLFSAPREGLPSDPIDNQHKGTKPLVCVDDSSRNALNFMSVVYTSLVPTKKHVINMRYRNKPRLPVLPLK